jgi:hypothetical protein
MALLTISTFCGVAFPRSDARPDSEASSDDRVVARGGGTTIIQGGTGAAGGFTPVLTKVAFHVERESGAVTGGFECLALAPEATSGSGQFTVNAMYVTGQITAATVHGDTATLTGTATITGIGAGTSVPFTFVVGRGGPGATSVLTVNSSSVLVFHEILIEGNFEIRAH